jgi:peptidoglycan/xylan/chitin deacetylase (PgdA/CDA1 family)
VAALKRRIIGAVYDAAPRSLIIRRGPRHSRRVALTFDDGPDDLTAEYLDTLARLATPATFFVMGDTGAKNPDRLREYMRRGHQIAVHGYHHRRFTEMSWRELDDELRRASAVIPAQQRGRPWVRPPYGAIDARVVAQLLATGWTIAMWSVDSQDYDIHDPAGVAARCMPELIQPGDVLLFHEGQRWTLDALPRIVEGLQRMGYECVTMADLVAG